MTASLDYLRAMAPGFDPDRQPCVVCPPGECPTRYLDATCVRCGVFDADPGGQLCGDCEAEVAAEATR